MLRGRQGTCDWKSNQLISLVRWTLHGPSRGLEGSVQSSCGALWLSPLSSVSELSWGWEILAHSLELCSIEHFSRCAAAHVSWVRVGMKSVSECRRATLH